MILIIAGNYSSAEKWARTQMLNTDEWFSTLDLDELKSKSNFHVITIESASELPSPLFERIFHIAKQRGKMNKNEREQNG
jgi:hypothetical protein